MLYLKVLYVKEKYKLCESVCPQKTHDTRILLKCVYHCQVLSRGVKAFSESTNTGISQHPSVFLHVISELTGSPGVQTQASCVPVWRYQLDLVVPENLSGMKTWVEFHLCWFSSTWCKNSWDCLSCSVSDVSKVFFFSFSFAIRFPSHVLYQMPYNEISENPDLPWK